MDIRTLKNDYVQSKQIQAYSYEIVALAPVFSAYNMSRLSQLYQFANTQGVPSGLKANFHTTSFLCCLYGMLASVIGGFLFGFIVNFLTQIFIRIIVEKQRCNDYFVKYCLKESILPALYFCVTTFVLYQLPIFLSLFFGGACKVVLSETTVTYVFYAFTLIPFALTVFIYNTVKQKDFRFGLKILLPALIYCLNTLCIGSLSIWLKGWLKIISIFIGLAGAVALRVLFAYREYKARGY